MKAMPLLLAISLAANLVLGWMLWQRHPVHAFDPAIANSSPTEDDLLPLPSTPQPLTVSALLPPIESEPSQTTPVVLPSARAFLAPPDSEKAYGPSPPPNAHAYPPWPQRVPYRDSQETRSLIADPAR